MNQRDESRGSELERRHEGNGGHDQDQYERDNYPTHGSFGPQGQRRRSVTNEWEAARGYGGGADELAYGGGRGRYEESRYGRGQERGMEGRYSGEGRHGWEAGASQPYYGPRGSRGSWRDRSPGQDPYGFGQRTHWREPYQYAADRTRYRDSRPSGHFPRDQFGREHSSEQLFEREPFGRREDTHYYGTGSVGWGGPGFTGGGYAYGEGTRYEHLPLEGEYSDESTVSYEDQVRRDYRATPRTRRYPPGPKGYQRSDERLKEDISERLMEAYHIDSSEVTVDVRGAKVTLEGMVPSRHMKHAIEDLVDCCPGVLDIDNRIRVTGPNYQGSSPTGSAGGSSSTSGSMSGTNVGSSKSKQ